MSTLPPPPLANSALPSNFPAPKRNIFASSLSLAGSTSGSGSKYDARLVARALDDDQQNSDADSQSQYSHLHQYNLQQQIQQQLHKQFQSQSQSQSQSQQSEELGDAWQSVALKVLPLFNGAPLTSGFMESMTSLVASHINQRGFVTAQRDAAELLATGMLTLRAKLDSLLDSRLLTRTVEIWTLFMGTLLPYLQGCFLPLSNAGMDVRQHSLSLFTNSVLLTLSERLLPLLEDLGVEVQHARELSKQRSQASITAGRLKQMLLILSTNSPPTPSLEPLLKALSGEKDTLPASEKRKAWMRAKGRRTALPTGAPDIQGEEAWLAALRSTGDSSDDESSSDEDQSIKDRAMRYNHIGTLRAQSGDWEKARRELEEALWSP